MYNISIHKEDYCNKNTIEGWNHETNNWEKIKQTLNNNFTDEQAEILSDIFLRIVNDKKFL